MPGKQVQFRRQVIEEPRLVEEVRHRQQKEKTAPAAHTAVLLSRKRSPAPISNNAVIPIYTVVSVGS